MKGWYLYLATIRWFGIRIGMLVAVFVAAVVFISIPLSSRKQTSVIYFDIRINFFTFKMSFIRVECWFSRSWTNVQCFTCWHVSVLCETEC